MGVVGMGLWETGLPRRDGRTPWASYLTYQPVIRANSQGWPAGMAARILLDLLQRPVVGQLAAGLMPPILLWQSSYTKSATVSNFFGPPSRRTYGPKLGPGRRKWQTLA